MTKFIAAVAFAAVIASPAFAQSYDPSVGSGNIAAQVTVNPALGAYAQHPRMSMERSDVLPAARPFTADEKALFDRIPIE